MQLVLPVRLPLVEVARRLCPESEPVRLRTFEPPQGRLEHGDDESFVETWEAVANIPHGGLLFFPSRPPCCGGTIAFPDQREGACPRAARRTRALTLDFDGRALEDDRWRDVVVSLFVQVARRLSAFCAMAYVQRNVIARRGRLWHGGESESYTLPRGRCWLSIPPTRTWLPRFGVPYRAGWSRR